MYVKYQFYIACVVCVMCFIWHWQYMVCVVCGVVDCIGAPTLNTAHRHTDIQAQAQAISTGAYTHMLAARVHTQAHTGARALRVGKDGRRGAFWASNRSAILPPKIKENSPPTHRRFLGGELDVWGDGGRILLGEQREQRRMLGAGERKTPHLIGVGERAYSRWRV
jgi:hypothetical protein